MCRKVICKNSNLALRPQITEKINIHDEVKIVGSIIDEKSIKQLWTHGEKRWEELNNKFLD